MLFQSQTAKGRNTPPVPYQAGIEAVAVFDFTFSAAFTAASDVLEIGTLPAGAQLTGATVMNSGTGSQAITVGIMSGEAGAKDNARTSGNQIFNAVTVNNAEADATTANCLNLAPATTHRGIGVKVGADVTAGASKKIRLLIRYVY